MRPQFFTEQTIVDYDTEIRTHLTATIQGLVAVAHRDEAAFHALEHLVKEVWARHSSLSRRSEGMTRGRMARKMERAYPFRLDEASRR